MSMKKRSETVIMGLNNIPLLNADIVTGISLMMTFLVFGISLNWGTVLLSHVTFCIPYVILSVMPKFKQMTPNSYEAALDLGCTPVKAFLRVVIPEISSGILTGFLMSFTFSLDDFIITYFTSGSSFQTLPVTIYSMTRMKVNPQINALSALMFVAVLLLLLLMNLKNFRNTKKKGVAN